MIKPPPIAGIRAVPRKEKDEPEAAETQQQEPVRERSPQAAHAYIRPRHKPMNCYPTEETKADFEDRVEDLATAFRKTHGVKIPNGVIHEVALSLVLEQWDTIVDRLMN